MMQHLTSDTLIDYIHEELDATADAAALAHLQTCAECSAAYEAEARLNEALKTLPSAELPPMVKARIWEAVRNEQASPYARLIAFFRPAVAVPVAAALAVALYFVSPFAHRAPAGPTVDANYYLEQHAADEIGNPLGERSVSSTVLETSDAPGTAPSLGTGTAAAAALNAVE